MLKAEKSRYSSGKAFYKLFLMLLIIAAGFTNLYAQNQVDIKLKQPPPNKLGVGDMWNLELNNTSGKDMKIYLTGTATEEKDGLIIEGKSKVFTLKPGRSTYKYNDFSNAEVKYNNGKYKEIILRTGNAPEGSYTICVTAFDEGGTEIGRENCIMQSVQQMGGITLLTPGDGEEIDPDTLPGLMFTWTPLPKGGPYSLRIVELKGSESKEEGIRANRPIIDKEKISISSYQLGSTDPKLEAGKRYAWQVTSGDVQSDIFIYHIINLENNEKIFTDPYEISTMKYIYSKLKKLKRIKGDVDLVVTHKHIKFNPESEEELELLNSDTALFLYSYPLNRKVTKSDSTEKLKTSKEENLTTSQYCVVDSDHKLPNVKNEILSELFLNRKGNNGSRDLILDEDSWMVLENEALRITGRNTGRDPKQLRISICGVCGGYFSNTWACKCLDWNGKPVK